MSALEDLHRHCTVALDGIGKEHRSGHQRVHARRYVVSRSDGSSVETVIIVKPGSRLQIWCEAKVADRIKVGSLGGTYRPGSETYSRRNDKGELLYGRHSSLKTMDHLHRGDAYHFSPSYPREVDAIIELIMNTSRS
jgi:hypothetical protein